MKNIKPIFIKCWRAWMWFCAIVLSAFLLVAAAGFISLYTQFDFGTDFYEIDTCIDGGGKWDKAEGNCERIDKE